MIGLKHGVLRFFGKIVLLGAMFASPLCLLAQSNNPPETGVVQSSSAPEAKALWKDITTHGYLSLSHNYNTNDPSPRINGYRVFDFNENDPQLDVAQLVVQRPVSESGPGAPLLAFCARGGLRITPNLSSASVVRQNR